MEIISLILVIVFFFFFNSKIRKIEEENNQILSLFDKYKKGLINVNQKDEVEPEFEGQKYIIKNSQESISKPKDLKPKKDENFFAEKVLPILGILTVLFGIGFFLSYAFEKNWIDQPTRVILGFVSGLAFIAVGKALLQKLGNYAVFLIGGGISILYLSAKFGLEYKLYDNTFAFIVMIIITAVAYFVSYITNSKTLAFISTIGGFLTPLLVSSGNNDYFVLFSYITILLLGVLFVTYKKNWQSVLAFCFVSTAVWFTVTFFDVSFHIFGSSKLYLYAEIFLAFLLVYFVYFTVVPFVFYLSKQSENKAVQSSGLIISAFSGFGLLFFGYPLLEAISKDNKMIENLYFVLPLLAFVLYVAMTKILISKNKIQTDKKSVYFFLIMSVISIGAVPLYQFAEYQNIVILSWFGIALALAFLAHKTKTIVFAKTTFLPVVAGSLFVFFDKLSNYNNCEYNYELNTCVQNDVPFFNFNFATVLISALILITIYHLTKKVLGSSAKVFSALGHLSILALISAEVYKHFDRTSLEVTMLPIFYTIYSFGMLYLGVLRKSSFYKNFAIIIFGYVILKLYFVDVWAFDPLFRIIAFLALGLIMLIASYYYYKNKEKIKEFLS
ncbi:hypothetical protein CSB11_02810 [Candidatus Campbellbacteria bacterium]|nr:MAG: hypothetical protein CSB11_02810 [Candidatus Campbellbacteria bacterium]